MVTSLFCGDILDDILRGVIQDINDNGINITPSGGPCKEISGIQIELNNPHSRLSRTETKGTIFSCLGELCWYLAQSNDLGFISYYLPKYKDYAENNIVFGGYGPRLFNWKGTNQIERVIERLKEHPDSRKAVIQLFDSTDLDIHHNDVPCTCLMQFMIRDSKLNMIVYMRSNDVFIGLPHDIFCFTMIQEIISKSLQIDMGYYKHFVGSLHLYKSNFVAAEEYLREGWQSTFHNPMPCMPNCNPCEAIKDLIKAESQIRLNGQTDIDIQLIDPYWADFIRLLKIFYFWKVKNFNEIDSIKKEISNTIYLTYINNKLMKSAQ
jgi:thymidylate synthase